jgi:hypothetical protein
MRSPDEVESYPYFPEVRDKVYEEARVSIEQFDEMPAELKKEILGRIDLFVDRQIVTSSTTRFQTGQLGWTHWAVRKDQLKLLEALSPVAIAIVTYTTAVAGSPYVLAAALLFASLNLASRLKNKGVKLEPDDYRVLLALKKTGAVNLEELTAVLNGLNLIEPLPFTASRVGDTLARLKAIRANDGTLEPLVVEASDGKWSSNGV